MRALEPAPDDSPLGAEQRAALAAAQQEARVILRAASIASFNGWTTGVLALFSAPFALLDPSSALVALALFAVAANELAGRRELLALRGRGPRRLALNQLALLGLVVAYCAWRLFASWTGPSPYASYAQGDDRLARMLGPLDDLQRRLALLVYGGAVALSVLVQGLTARYYWRQRDPLRRYVASTPAWILELQRLARTR